MRNIITVLVLTLVACGPEKVDNSNFDAGGGTGGNSGTGGSGGTGGDAAVDSGLDGSMDAAVDSGSDAGDSGMDATLPLPCGVSCGGSTPHCDTTSMTCVACLNTGHCGDEVCDTATHTCVTCTADEGCGVDTVCNVANRTCVECVGTLGCTSPEVCADDGNTCVACNMDDDCNSASLVCLTDGHTCVECNVEDDCDGTEQCKPSTNECVQCLADSDCTSAGAAKCNLTTNTCIPCDDNAQCTGVMDGATALGVCSSGTCVECTVADETACSGNSCNPATTRCTNTPLASRQPCEQCRADSECAGGVYDCVPMNFNGTPRPGGYCLRRKGNTDCGRPLSVLIAAVSLSGTAGMDYCGLDETLTTCEAVLARTTGVTCENGQGGGNSALCGAPGLDDAVCATVGGNDFRCTYPCSEVTECPGTSTTVCPMLEPYCH